MKVAIVGSAEGRDEAPYADLSYEIWGLNDLYRSVQYGMRFTRWFEIHGDTPLTRSRRPPDHWARLAAFDIPVYTFHDLPTVPKATRLDYDVLRAVAGRDYFACTMAYQMALAISEGATEIALYGIVLSGAREALVERPCLEWWLGLAEGRGITVSVEHPYRFGLGRHEFRYAIDDQDERADVHGYVYGHHTHSFHWLIEEAKRLQLLPEQKDALVEQE